MKDDIVTSGYLSVVLYCPKCGKELHHRYETVDNVTKEFLTCECSYEILNSSSTMTTAVSKNYERRTIKMPQQTKPLTLSDMKAQLENDATKRCAQQEVTIKALHEEIVNLVAANKSLKNTIQDYKKLVEDNTAIVQEAADIVRKSNEPKKGFIERITGKSAQ